MLLKATPIPHLHQAPIAAPAPTAKVFVKFITEFILLNPSYGIRNGIRIVKSSLSQPRAP